MSSLVVVDVVVVLVVIAAALVLEHNDICCCCCCCRHRIVDVVGLFLRLLLQFLVRLYFCSSNKYRT